MNLKIRSIICFLAIFGSMYFNSVIVAIIAITISAIYEGRIVTELVDDTYVSTLVRRLVRIFSLILMLGMEIISYSPALVVNRWGLVPAIILQILILLSFKYLGNKSEKWQETLQKEWDTEVKYLNDLDI